MVVRGLSQLWDQGIFVWFLDRSLSVIAISLPEFDDYGNLEKKKIFILSLKQLTLVSKDTKCYFQISEHAQFYHNFINLANNVIS